MQEVKTECTEKYQATVTVRLIRSFEHRNIRPVVLKNVDLHSTGIEFQTNIMEYIKKQKDLPPPVRNYSYDTLKILHKRHGAKTNDPVINTDNDEMLILQNHRSLLLNGVENETEISFFNKDDYEEYKRSPFCRW